MKWGRRLRGVRREMREAECEFVDCGRGQRILYAVMFFFSPKLPVCLIHHLSCNNLRSCLINCDIDAARVNQDCI